MEDYYEYLDSNGVTTLYKLIKDDTVALIDSYSVTINGITTNLDNHVNNTDIHTPIATIEGIIDTAIGSLNYATPDYVDTKVADLVNSSPETLDTLKELSDALGNDSNFATTVANQIGSKASKDDVYTKLETDTLLEGKANSVHNHVVSDITDMPTIPTKTSQLINDSGFLTSSSGVITSVSWSDITDKPNFSTVATSGSYTDLSNTPTIPTKVSQLENDMGFGTGGDTSDCVHKTGDETIDDTKTFTSGPWVTNNQTTTGYSIKNTAIARNDIPAEYQHYTFRAYDKNSKILGEYCIEKSTTGCTLLNMNVRSEDSTGKQLSESLVLNMSNDGSAVRFYPSSDNKMDLGMSNAKWAKVYSDDVVHTSGNEIIAGIKTFNDTVVQKKDGIIKNDNVDITTTPSSNFFTHLFFADKNSVANAYMRYGQRTNGINELNLFVRDKDLNNYGVSINTNNEFIPVLNNTYSLGSTGVKWKKIYSDDVVHTSGDETINGIKTFTSGINFKNNNIDLTVTPSSTLTSNFIFKDKNDQNVSFIQYAKRNTDPDLLGLYIYDKDKNLHGIQITSNNYLLPIGNNVYSLGSPNNKWSKVYSDDVVHTSSNETIKGDKTFDNNITVCGNLYDKNVQADLTQIPTSNVYTQYRFVDKNNKTMGYVQHVQRTTGINQLSFIVRDSNNVDHGFFVTTDKALLPAGNNTYSLGASSAKWANVYATTFNGNLKGTIDSSTTATTQATSDNSTKIATTAWVRTYVNSVGGSSAVSLNAVNSSISAYYSNATTLTAEGSSSSLGGSYPSDYSDYIDISPTVGTIYTGSQLFGTLSALASGSKDSYTESGSTVYHTTAKATANFSGAFSPSAKYLCTTANAVKFRAFVSEGTTSDMGTATVVDNSSTKSIFTRIE